MPMGNLAAYGGGNPHKSAMNKQRNQAKVLRNNPHPPKRRRYAGSSANGAIGTMGGGAG